MAVNLARDEEEYLQQLSAGEAATPMYLGMQGEGAAAIGDIFGVDTPGIDTFVQEQQDALRGFNPKYPERLMDTPSPVSWWGEKAALNSMNTIVPMMGFAIGSTMQAIPHPIAKIVGSAINWGTYALTYNANFADTLQEHEERAGGRELSAAEKGKAAIVASAVTMLDVIVPKKGASAISEAIAKTFGKGGLEATKKSLQKIVLTNRQSLAAQTKTGGKYLGGLVGREMGTEAAQKALQIGTSVEPGRLATSEGLQDVLEESVVAGPTVGIIGSPAAVGQARSFNRDIGTARRLAKDFNQGLAAEASEKSTKSIKDSKIKIPEYQSTFNTLAKQGSKMFEKKVGAPIMQTTMGEKVVTPIVEGLKAGYKGVAEKPLAAIDRIARNADSGFVYHSANKLRQMFVPVESSSGIVNENIGNNDFYSVRDVKSGYYLEPITDVIAQYTQRKRGFGDMMKSSNPKVMQYLRESLQDKKPSIALLEGTPFATQLNKKGDALLIDDNVRVIRRVLKDRIFKDFRQSGIDIREQENYLTNPLSSEAVAKNRKAFIRLLKKSNQKAIRLSKGKKVKRFTKEQLEKIADDVIGNVDPNVITIRESMRKKKKKDSVKTPAFEKSRSESFKYLDEFAAQEGLNFRETNLETVLTGYAQKAATRVASVRAFGKNGVLLRKRLDELNSQEAITQKEIDRVYDVYDAVHNLYKKDADPNLLAVSKVATTVGAITHLGLATLSSITELAWIGERAGFGNMLKTLPDAFKYSMEGYRKLKTSDYVARGDNQRTMALLGFNLDPRVNERLDALFATDHNQILNAWFRGPLGGYLTQWTNFNRNWAAQAMLSNINSRANGIVSGDISDIELKRLDSELKENGVSRENWQAMIDIFTNPETGKVNVNILDDDKMDMVLQTKQMMVKPATTKKPAQFLSKKDAKQIKVRDLLVPWLHKVVDDVVVHPKATNKPMWMSDPKLAIFAQLKTFPVVFGNTVVKRLLKKMNPKQCNPDFGAAVGAIGGIATAYALVYIAEMMKDAIRGQDFDEPGFRESLDRAGLTGWVGAVAGSGRFQGDATTALGGTALGFVNRAFEEFITPVYTGEEGNMITRAGSEGIPNLFDWLNESIEGALGPAGAYFKPLSNLIDED